MLGNEPAIGKNFVTLFRMNSNMFKTISTSLLVEQNEIKLVYTTPKQLHIGQDGHFKLTIEGLEIENG